ncbi:hypothetical protein DPM33_29990 [Mesorhizobium hawassense]|uniref:Uncharacterized protein n=2 Tax=Mesorhizobium hawassense TaxID=1209954 RepID=A0A330HFZ3_9HYPH|nr:hypothetical protein DPM33_29990 [Mesorhizobium hawassense]
MFLSGPDGFAVLFVGTLMAAVYAAPLAIPMVVVSRFLRTRHRIMFAFTGVLVGIFMFAVMYADHPRVERPPGLDVLVALIMAGGLGSTVYRLAESRFLQIAGQAA